MLEPVVLKVTVTPGGSPGEPARLCAGGAQGLRGVFQPYKFYDSVCKTRLLTHPHSLEMVTRGDPKEAVSL